ncbi:hypothetical protein BP5796_01188 [Coleophoma crateriformis]|uniref:Uncharacterized protein n=1 Tax=Coleophoma crateriformis TaxID=565419 RepID=A0A3D8SZS5_9HELO|nr:hypothetical protein BP5796_01188 [Coleophoma crateriformis]
MTKIGSDAIALFTVGGSLLFSAVVSVGLRLYVRLCLVKSLGLDDYLMIFALVLYALAESMLFCAMGKVVGKGPLELVSVMSSALKFVYVGEIL